MPLYALDDHRQIIAARDADEWRRYRCLECNGAMQKRAGANRQAHFYHLNTVRQCRLHSRGIDHMILQTTLQEQNPALIIERPFEKILRIADLCWENKKIVFEIQCSPIAWPEVQRRIQDYAREGYELVWLLDNRLYNRRTLRAAEADLREHACYYFSLSKSLIYDQFEVLSATSRLAKGPPLPINLFRPMSFPLSPPSPLTRQLNNRRKVYYFAGDLFDRSLRYPIYLERLIEHEDRILAQEKNERKISFWLKKYFYIGLEYLLRKSAD